MPPLSVPSSSAAPPSPGRLLLRAFLWLLAAQFIAAATAFLIAFAAGFYRAWGHRHGGPAWQPTPFAFAFPATIALQGMLLLAALRQGRILGQGDLRAGLGAGPARRHGLVTIFVLVIVAWVLGYIAILNSFPALANRLASDVPAALDFPRSPGVLLLGLRVLIIVGVAPLAEELFFRGWLWTALRRRWSAWPTALCTGGIWLAMHAIGGAVRVPILVPAAILLSLARHYGGSVRASLPIHMANNATAVGIQLIALAAGP